MSKLLKYGKFSIVSIMPQNNGLKNYGDYKKRSRESLFLRKLVLGVPAQASGKNLTRPPMPSATPAVSYDYVQDRLCYSRSIPDKGHEHRCAMTRRDFIKPCIFTPQTALRKNTQPHRFWGLKSTLRYRYVSRIFSDGCCPQPFQSFCW